MKVSCSLHGLINDRKGVLKDIEHRLALCALRAEVIVLLEQVVKQLLLVKSGDETVLDSLARVVDEQMHNCLGNQVLDRFTGDVKVRCDQ